MVLEKVPRIRKVIHSIDFYCNLLYCVVFGLVGMGFTCSRLWTGIFGSMIKPWADPGWIPNDSTLSKESFNISVSGSVLNNDHDSMEIKARFNCGTFGFMTIEFDLAHQHRFGKSTLPSARMVAFFSFLHRFGHVWSMYRRRTFPAPHINIESCTTW